MSLKGFEYVEESKVLMRFFFKDLSLYIYQELNKSKIEKFKKYINDNGFTINKIIEVKENENL